MLLDLEAKATPGPWQWMHDHFNKRIKQASQKWVYLLCGRLREDSLPVSEQYVDEFDRRCLWGLRWSTVKRGRALATPEAPHDHDREFIVAACNAARPLGKEVLRLREECERLRAAVRNQAGDNLCWLKDDEIGSIPPEAEFLESCRRFHGQMSGRTLAGSMTIAQLEAEIERLRQENRNWSGLLTCLNR